MVSFNKAEIGRNEVKFLLPVTSAIIAGRSDNKNRKTKIAFKKCLPDNFKIFN
ncbi:hypothetical protein D3C78_1903170 [compost metagenome]